VTAPDYKHIAEEAVSLLCSLGYLGLDPSQQRRLWQEALDLDRRLHPWRPPVTVWTEAEGSIEPPRRIVSCTPRELADACPSCPPGDHPPEDPQSVAEDGKSIRATYRHKVCGTEWDCWWNQESVDGGWPLHREHPAVAP
jgi:hypothetical protein